MFDNSDRSFLLQVLAITNGDNGRHGTRADAADGDWKNDTSGLRRSVIAALTGEVSRVAEHVKAQE